GQFVIQVGSEQMLVKTGQGTTTWTVQRGYNGTTEDTHATGAAVSFVLGTTTLQTDLSNPTPTTTTITVASASGFPSSAPFVIQVDSEQMLVTGVQGTTMWTVTRGYNGTPIAPHAIGATLSLRFTLLADKSITSAATAQTSTTRLRLTAGDNGL